MNHFFKLDRLLSHFQSAQTLEKSSQLDQIPVL